MSHVLLDLPRVISVQKAAEIVGISRSAMYTAVTNGDFKAIKVNNRWWVLTGPLLRKLDGEEE